MTLRDFIKRLKAFDCEALRDCEVTHYFADKLAYGYEEKVRDVTFDPKSGRIVLECEPPVAKILPDLMWRYKDNKEKED